VSSGEEVCANNRLCTVILGHKSPYAEEKLRKWAECRGVVLGRRLDGYSLIVLEDLGPNLQVEDARRGDEGDWSFLLEKDTGHSVGEVRYAAFSKTYSVHLDGSEVRRFLGEDDEYWWNG